MSGACALKNPDSYKARQRGLTELARTLKTEKVALAANSTSSKKAIKLCVGNNQNQSIQRPPIAVHSQGQHGQQQDLRIRLVLPKKLFLPVNSEVTRGRWSKISPIRSLRISPAGPCAYLRGSTGFRRKAPRSADLACFSSCINELPPLGRTPFCTTFHHHHHNNPRTGLYDSYSSILQRSKRHRTS